MGSDAASNKTDTSFQTSGPHSPEAAHGAESASSSTTEDEVRFPELLSDKPCVPAYVDDIKDIEYAIVPFNYANDGVNGRYPLSFDAVLLKLKIYLGIRLRIWRYLLHGAGWNLKMADERLENGQFGDRKLKYFWAYNTLIDDSQKNTHQFMPYPTTKQFNQAYKEKGKLFELPRSIKSPLTEWETEHYDIALALGKASLYFSHVHPGRTQIGNALRKNNKPRHSTLQKRLLGLAEKQTEYRPIITELIHIAACAHIDPSGIWPQTFGIRGLFHAASMAGYRSEGYRPEKLSAEGEDALVHWGTNIVGRLDKESEIDRALPLLLTLMPDTQRSGHPFTDFVHFCHYIGYNVEVFPNQTVRVAFAWPDADDDAPA